ncbi:putative phosphatidylglycerol/phosphatidylinositol transfer protein DDB_G0282107 isoform X2 [Mytilus trossulus]|uniref:putative phosphatidylglycerol/phosphatidylinositol transfer protein DDB_G0282107 isoform X2 n=1 Tax=Mytilus trossulus TaxID=6551 RepID=UPI003006D8DD
MRIFGIKMNCRKIPLIILLILMCSVFSLYMIFFNHGPPEEILKTNLKKSAGRKANEDVDELTDSEIAWRKFIKDNNYVAIGTLWDSCDGDKDTIGKVILLPDKQSGGIKSRTFVNVTFGEEYNGGELGISVKYNGKDLYDNKWDFCSIDENEEEEDRQVFCPYKPGYHAWITDRKVPKYLPKGTYFSKTWLTDGEGELVACGFSEFVL